MRSLLFLMLATSASAQSPKNIVVILADDMGLASLHAEHAGSGLPTANLDRLRSQGMSFTDAHSPSAVCSPTRYALLTGRYSWRSRLKSGIVGKWERPLIAEDRLTIADLAGSADRHSACIGKWHLGWRWPKTGGGVTSKSLEIDYTQPILRRRRPELAALCMDRG
jgi:arylsulfatase A